MKILNLKIYGFGNIVSKEFNFADGTNEIQVSSREEAETIRDFIVTMFYGLGGRSDGGFRKKYFPGTMIRFGGEMNVEVSGRTYYISQFFGLTKSGDESKYIETPGSRQVPVSVGKTIGEVLLNVQEPAFKAAFNLDFDSMDGRFCGYLTPELGFCLNAEDSFFAAEERLFKRASEIKCNENKDGELDRLIIQKMNKTNELTRLSEIDLKIASKKNQLDSLENTKAELVLKSKDLYKRINLSKSCATLLEKDKVLALSQTINSDIEKLEILENQKFYIEKRDLKKELKVPLIVLATIIALAILTGVLAILGKVHFILPLVFLLAVIVAGIFVIGKKKDFDERFISRGGTSNTDIYGEIKGLKRKIAMDTEDLSECLDGKLYNEKENEWREAEAVLREASEDDRRNAVLRKNDADEKRYQEINAEIEPVIEQITAAENEIHELSANLSAAYSDASGALLGIDDKIKSLTREYKTISLAREVLKASVTEVRKNLMPKIFASARSIYNETYGAKFIDYEMQENGAIFVKCDENMRKEALLALKIAIDKNLFIGESGFAFCTISSEVPARLPLDLKQLIKITVC